MDATSPDGHPGRGAIIEAEAFGQRIGRLREIGGTKYMASIMNLVDRGTRSSS
jgi:hypothetical protein